MYARKAVLAYTILMICQAHFSSMTEGELVDDQVSRGLTEKYDLACQGDLGDSSMEVERPVKMTHSGTLCQRVHQVKTVVFASLHEDDWAGEL